MEKRPKSENELIQEGLERFLEQELRGVSLEREQKRNVSENKREQDLQVIMPNEQRQKPAQVFANEDIGGLDLDFDESFPGRSGSASGIDYNERVSQSNNGRNDGRSTRSAGNNGRSNDSRNTDHRERKSTGGNSRNNSRNNRKPNNDYNRGRNKPMARAGGR